MVFVLYTTDIADGASLLRTFRFGHFFYQCAYRSLFTVAVDIPLVDFKFAEIVDAEIG
jgi:hypothetical protein